MKLACGGKCSSLGHVQGDSKSSTVFKRLTKTLCVSLKHCLKPRATRTLRFRRRASGHDEVQTIRHVDYESRTVYSRSRSRRVVVRCAVNGDGGDGEEKDENKRRRGEEGSGHCGFLFSLALCVFLVRCKRQRERGVSMKKKCWGIWREWNRKRRRKVKGKFVCRLLWLLREKRRRFVYVSCISYWCVIVVGSKFEETCPFIFPAFVAFIILVLYVTLFIWSILTKFASFQTMGKRINESLFPFFFVLSKQNPKYFFSNIVHL